MLRIIGVCIACLFLHGCFFVFIPGSVISSVSDSIGGYEGQNCVGRTAKVGDKIRLTDGTVGTVTKLEGESSRCSGGVYPVRAVVTPEGMTGRALTYQPEPTQTTINYVQASSRLVAGLNKASITSIMGAPTSTAGRLGGSEIWYWKADGHTVQATLQDDKLDKWWVD